MQNNLTYLLSKKYDMTFSMNWVGTQPNLFNVGDSQKLSTNDTTTGIKNFTSYDISTEEETTNSYLKILFKYKNSPENCENWSDLIPIENITGLTLNSSYTFDIELQVFRVDDSITGNIPSDIYLNYVKLYGDYEYTVTDSLALLLPGEETILEPIETYKVFDLEDYQINARNLKLGGYEIKYRFTQNNGRSYTEWENLTTENLKTLRLDELRFANVQYLIKNIGTDTFIINDITLIGDFQNVSADYIKVNRYGLREDCITFFQNTTVGINAFNKNALTNGLSCYQNPLTDLENKDKSGFWNPYDFDKIVGLANLFGGHVSDIAGWTSTYCLADPDGNGIDKYLHEHQLKNIIDMQDVKIIIPENKFPNETIKINIFNLDLFDTFEVHIMKDPFKEAFGITKRPGEDDIVYICESNRLFRVKHAQAFREVMNASTYYKVILEKYEDRKNIQFIDEDAKDLIDELTKNTSIDEILGIENEQDEDKISNKEQTYTLSFDKIRAEIHKDVLFENYNINQDNTTISKSQYDFKDVIGNTAVDYLKTDPTLGKGNNRSFITWFNFNYKYTSENYLSNEVFDAYTPTKNAVFPLLYNYDTTEKLGYRYWLEYDKLIFQINEKYFSLEYNFMTGIWYGIIINLNQKQGSISLDIYKRSYDIEITMFNKDYEKITMTTEDTIENSHEQYNTGYTYTDAIADGYEPVKNIQNIYSVTDDNLTNVSSITYENIEPSEFSHDQSIKIIGSDIQYTNLRLFNDVIKEESQENLLKQFIIKDAQYLILSDNSSKQVITTNYWNKNFK